MPPEPLLRRVDCVTVPVPDLDEGLRWYGGVLGHTLLWRDDAVGQAGLRLPDGDSELVLTRSEPYAPGWLVASVATAVDVVVHGGGRLVEGPRDIPVGVLAIVEDPFGNPLVLLEDSRSSGEHGGLGAGEDLARVRTTYDRVAGAYADALAGELAAKPLDRALLGTLAELAAGDTLADVGCGPGHVTAHLALQHDDVRGYDLSPRMVELARARSPHLRFEVADMRALPAADGAWAGIAALYSVIHLTAAQRRAAFAEFRRVLRYGGHLLVAFHVEDASHRPGDISHLTSWFGHDVDVDGHFLDPDVVTAELARAGLAVTSTLLRLPDEAVEYPSRRAYLLCTAR